MPNRQLLQDIQRRQRDLRMQALNPDKVQEIIRVKESYVRQDDLEAFKNAITRLLAHLSNELDQLKTESTSTLINTKKSLGRTISSEAARIRQEFSTKISEIESELGTSFDDIERLRSSGGVVPKGLIEKINSFVVQRSVSIPVSVDQGGTGATTAAQARTNLGITSGSGITRSITVTSTSVTAGSTSDVDYVYLVAGAHTITLPTAVSNTNRYTIKNNHSANITIDTTSAQTIDGTTSISIAPEESVDIISTNTNWSIT